MQFCKQFKYVQDIFIPFFPNKLMLLLKNQIKYKRFSLIQALSAVNCYFALIVFWFLNKFHLPMVDVSSFSVLSRSSQDIG